MSLKPGTAKRTRGKKFPSVEDLRSATHSYLRATCAYRDAVRLLDLGLAMAADPALNVLEWFDLEEGSGPHPTLDQAIELVIYKESADLIDLYERDPVAFKAGRSVVEALAYMHKLIPARYVGGKCDLCKGEALRCAVRHAQGRSCA